MKHLVTAAACLAIPGACASHHTAPAAGVSIAAISEKDCDIAEACARAPARHRIARLTDIEGVAALARIIVPTRLTSTRNLRESAAQLRTDILLVYTPDASFRTELTQIGPLQAIALGMFATKNAIVTSTCSLARIDLRTDFMHGAGGATASEEKRSNLRGSRDAADKARLAAGTRAFDQALEKVSRVWTNALLEHARGN